MGGVAGCRVVGGFVGCERWDGRWCEGLRWVVWWSDLRCVGFEVFQRRQNQRGRVGVVCC